MKTMPSDFEENLKLQCLYCGNKVYMNVVSEYFYDGDDFQPEGYGHLIYKMLSCPICGKASFHQRDFEFTGYDEEGNKCDDEKILFPPNTLDTHYVPKEIKKAYESALKVRNIDNEVCLLALRRTLELMLVDKGATKWGLKDKIKELAGKGILPNTLKEATFIAKTFGDEAAHKDRATATEQDINDIFIFIEHILEYFYILPGKISWLNMKLDNDMEVPF